LKNGADLVSLMIAPEGTAIVDCGSCTACCKRELVFLQPDEDHDQYPGVTIDRNPITGKMAYSLPHKPNGDCSYLGPAGCMIYDRRPLMCRAFSCIGLYERVMSQTTRQERRKSKIMNSDVMIAGEKRAKAAARRIKQAGEKA
jgi:Fe-S-cluster containining protein